MGPGLWQQHLPEGAAGPLVRGRLVEGGTLPGVWADTWAARPDATVLVDGSDPETALTAGRLAARTAAAAAGLSAHGIGPGDRVVWSCPSSLPSVVALVGALRLGAVVVPVSPSLTPGERAHVAADCSPAGVITAPGEEWAVAGEGLRCFSWPDLDADGPLPPLDAAQPADDALIVYTSGTTGRPKGAVHTHGSLLAGVRSLELAWGWGSDDRLILALPLFHVHGLCAGLFGTLLSGGSATVFERFSADAVCAAAPGSTMFFGVPTMYHRLAESGRGAALASLRLCVSGSAPLPAELWERLHRECGVEVLERYGMSETLLTLSNPLSGERRAGTVGTPLPGVEATLAAAGEPGGGVGELLVRGPMLCRGYWGRPAEPRPDGWFATGDLASVDADGYYSIRGRLTELIICGGHNVYPAEVEAVLLGDPAVAEVAVVGEPSDEWGEVVVAYVVGADGAPDLERLAERAAAELAPFKRPRAFRVLGALPRNAMGKVMRRQLAPGAPGHEGPAVA